jgi:two-component system cell cycle response regulator
MPDDASILPRAELDNGKPITTRALVKMADKLAPIPDVVFRLVELVDDPKCNASRVGRVVERDQALCASLLKLCNSGMYGAAVEIKEVRAAVTRVGLRAVRDMALASAVLKGANKVGADVVRGLRDQMVTAAGCTRVIASYLSQVAESEAFLAGMLLDVGRLVFAITVPVRYGELVAQASLTETPVEQLEEAWVGFTHAELGVEIARKWKFPSSVAYAIGRQHALAGLAGEDAVLDLTTCAAVLGAHMAAIIHDELGPEHASAEVLASHPAQVRLGLPETVLAGLLEECQRARFDAAALMDL